MRIEVETLGDGGAASLMLEDGILDEAARDLEDLGEPARDEPARLAFAATHLVMEDAYASAGHRVDDPATPEEIIECIDWKATEDIRRRVASEGLGIAEAMDTAQRFSIGWDGARRLIEMCGALELSRGFVAGAGSDCDPNANDVASLAAAVAFEADFIHSAGGTPVILPLPWLSLSGKSPDETVALYREIVDRCEGPLYIHWLGAMFLPSLEGYFPGDSFERVMALDREKIQGVKISLLDADREREIRRALAPAGQIVLTGDDFHFSSLIAGEKDAPDSFSHALLGIFDAIARPAGLALRFLDHGDRTRFREIMDPCEELARVVFEAPTQHYKAGLAFLAWVNGHQSNPMLANREDLCRDQEHYLRVLRAASRCGAVTDAQVTAQRVLAWMR